MTTFYRYPGASQPDVYEWENQIADPEQRIEAFMASVVSLDSRTIVDIGSGSAFHAARYATQHPGSRVFAVEPDPDMLAQAHRRLARNPLGNLSILAAYADDIPLRDGIADVVHSRFAYFFGPEDAHVRSCEPGIAEAMRLLKPDGTFFVIDNSLTDGDFARLLRRYAWSMSADGAEEQERRDAFWHGHGFARRTVLSSWSAPDRDVLRRVITMEFPERSIDAIMAEVDGAELTYGYDVYWRRKG